jgi:two-component system sensor kinase FixL
MLLSQAGGLLIWLIKHQRGLPWSRGGWMRPINFALIAVLVLPAILLPLHLKIAQLGWLPKLSAEILGSVLNLLIVVALLGWAIERMAHEQALLEERESALDASRAQLESILATVPDAMIVIDDHGRIQRFSAAAERLFGYRADEAIGRDVEMLMTEADRREDYLAHYRATGERHVIGHIRTFRARRADGVEIPIELSVGETRIDGKRIFTGFVRDISDRVAAEGHMEQLHAEYAQSARRNAMGEMAAALAHELNQPLAAAGNFLGTAEVMLERSDANDPAAEMLGKASAQLVRAGEIIRRLRDFMIGRDVELHVEDLSQIVADAAALAFVGLPPVEASYDIAREARMIFADRVQAQQVLVNILRNAAEAVRELPPELRRIVLVAGPADGDMVELCVLDTGPGFPRKLLENMRVPFLSTKAGRGMGVGLSISRRIVEAHGGRFTARNGPSGGGMVCFTLPLYRAEVGE